MRRFIIGLAYLWDMICRRANIGYECPMCDSHNTETIMEDRTQNCLACGHEFPLPLYLKIDHQWGITQD